MHRRARLGVALAALLLLFPGTASALAAEPEPAEPGSLVIVPHNPEAEVVQAGSQYRSMTEAAVTMIPPLNFPEQMATMWQLQGPGSTQPSQFFDNGSVIDFFAGVDPEVVPGNSYLVFITAISPIADGEAAPGEPRFVLAFEIIMPELTPAPTAEVTVIPHRAGTGYNPAEIQFQATPPGIEVAWHILRAGGEEPVLSGFDLAPVTGSTLVAELGRLPEPDGDYEVQLTAGSVPVRAANAVATDRASFSMRFPRAGVALDSNKNPTRASGSAAIADSTLSWEVLPTGPSAPGGPTSAPSGTGDTVPAATLAALPDGSYRVTFTELSPEGLSDAAFSDFERVRTPVDPGPDPDPDPDPEPKPDPGTEVPPTVTGPAPGVSPTRPELAQTGAPATPAAALGATLALTLAGIGAVLMARRRPRGASAVRPRHGGGFANAAIGIAAVTLNVPEPRERIFPPCHPTVCVPPLPSAPGGTPCLPFSSCSVWASAPG